MEYRQAVGVGVDDFGYSVHHTLELNGLDGASAYA